MTDLYIEQANSHFQHVWSGAGQLTTAMPQVADAVQMMQRQVLDLQTALRGALARIDAQDVATGLMKDEIARLQIATTASVRRVDALEGADGFVTKAQLATEVRAMPEVDSIKNLREQLMMMHHRQTEVTSELAERQRVVEERVPELIQRVVGEETRAIRANMSRLEEDVQNSSQRFTASVAKLTSSLHDVQVQTNRDLREATSTWSAQLKLASEESKENLEAAVAEVIDHLKQQAQIVDTLAGDMQKKHDNLPTMDQAERLRDEMRSLRRDMDQAQFRIHEAYSQIMSLSKLTAQGALDSSYGTSSRGSASAPLNPSRAHEAADGGKRGGEGGYSSSALDGVDAAAWMSAPQPTARLVDAALEPLRRDITKLQTSAIPPLSHAISAQREAMDGLVAMQSRGQQLLTNFLACVGLRDATDELFSSLEVMDKTHVVLLVRRALETVSVPLLSSAATASDVALRNGGEFPGVGQWSGTPSHATSSAVAASQLAGGRSRSGLNASAQATPVAGQSLTPHRAAHLTTQSSVDETPQAGEPWRTTASPGASSAGATTTPAGHTPLHYQRPSAQAPMVASSGPNVQPRVPFQLGADVADAVDGSGAEIMQTSRGSIAESLGLRRGDVVVRVNGTATPTASAFASSLRSAERSALAGRNTGAASTVTLLVRSAHDRRQRAIDVKIVP